MQFGSLLKTSVAQGVAVLGQRLLAVLALRTMQRLPSSLLHQEVSSPGLALFLMHAANTGLL